MATIKVRGERDPIIVSDAKAQSVKKAWLESKDRHAKVDLGNWSGELAQITAINTEPEPSYKSTIDYSDYLIPLSEWMKYTNERKISYGLAWFEFLFKGRNFKLKAVLNREPIPLTNEILNQAREILASHYLETPNDPLCPPEKLKELLPA